MTLASIGPNWSAKAAMARCHCDRVGPNATRMVSSRSNRIARVKFIALYLSRVRRALCGIWLTLRPVVALGSSWVAVVNMRTELGYALANQAVALPTPNG